MRNHDFVSGGFLSVDAAGLVLLGSGLLHSRLPEQARAF